MVEENEASDDLDSAPDPLDSWSDGAAFGAAEDTDEICDIPVEEWIKDIKMESTQDVPIPTKLVDRVIGQEAASIVIRKAAEQRRHVIMVGEPGTGKSMLARSMTEFLPKEHLEDILVYRNVDDENEPKVRTVPAGRGSTILSERKAHIKIQREKTNRT
ncbi:MAG: AAA domain-containing protein, partial [Euryarchaeota archaeon]|nr:AAA domain-containing protein [Euryarchaeota archaeon]